MTLIEYLNTKYPSGNFGLMSAEAKVFRIKYPLQTGWLQKHQNDAITPLQIRISKIVIEKRDHLINRGFRHDQTYISWILARLLVLANYWSSKRQNNIVAFLRSAFQV